LIIFIISHYIDSRKINYITFLQNCLSIFTVRIKVVR